MELSFQVQLDGDQGDTILRLPPGCPALGCKAGDYILDAMAVRVLSSREGVTGITEEALLLILQVTDDAIGLRPPQATGG